MVKDTHVHAKMQNVLREKINITTSALHKQLTSPAKRLHRSHVQRLKEKLRGYNVYPFADVPHIVTDSELDP